VRLPCPHSSGTAGFVKYNIATLDVNLDEEIFLIRSYNVCAPCVGSEVNV